LIRFNYAILHYRESALELQHNSRERWAELVDSRLVLNEIGVVADLDESVDRSLDECGDVSLKDRYGVVPLP
jgi:hypothetical protein